jgi:acetyl esterase/lipase
MLAVIVAPALIQSVPENRTRRPLLAVLLLCLAAASPFAVAQKVVDVPTRPGVTQRFLYLAPPAPKAAVILFAGGDGTLQISDNGEISRGGNFLVRTRQLFADQGLAVAVIDAPSDRKRHPFLSGFRQTPEHAADVKAVIAWLKDNLKVPVWLVGTSRGTQSAAYIATQLVAGGGPDGIVLTSTILTDRRSRPVPDSPLETLKIPVLVVHHEEDGCRLCQFSDMPRLMDKLAGLKRKELVSFRGGNSVGDPCTARAYHGFNGLENEVVAKIAAWITT